MSERAATRNRGMKRPRFVRIESWRYVRLDERWRAPRGKDSKTRKSKKGWPSMPSIGYRTGNGRRDIHPSGKREALVENLGDIERLRGRDIIGRISGGVGRKKRREMTDRAKELGVVLLNPLKERVLEEEAGTPG